jgi:RND family efflux transporter MFP subunit
MITYKRFIPIVSLVLLLSVLAGCGLFPEEEPLLAPPLMEPAEVSYSTVKAKRGDIVKTIRGSGSFVSIESKYMFFEARGGRLKEIHVKLGDEVKKGDLLAELYTDDIESQIKQQELALRKTQITYNQLKDSNGDKYDLEKASIDIEIARMKLNELREERDQSLLVTDVDGTVTYVDTRLGPGDNVSAFQNIMRIANPSNLYLAYSGSNLSSFTMGAKVDVTIGDKVYGGEVISTPANVPPDGDENLKNYVGITVKELPGDVKMGDNAQVSLILEESKNAIILPKQAVRNYMGRKYVNVLENGLNNERDVEIGVETATEVEIRKGVEEGEEIILR